MPPNAGGYEVEPFPRSRQPVVDMMRFAAQLHQIHGLLEIDVTEARSRIREHRERRGETLSFTAFVVACVVRAVADAPSLRSRRIGRRVVVPDDVDVSIIVERKPPGGGPPLPMPYVVCSADTKTVWDVHDEIRAAQTREVDDLGALTALGWVTKLPGFLRRGLAKVAMSSVTLERRLNLPTVAVSAVGMFGGGIGWGIPLSSMTLMVTTGGIGKRMVLVEGEPAERELLCLTLTMNHDLVDGGPAARFAARFRDALESADLIDLDARIDAGVSAHPPEGPSPKRGQDVP